jgi:hypothetical protein
MADQTPYQSTRQDRTRAYIVGGFYVFLAILLGIMLFKIWPPIPWPTPEQQDNGKLAALVAQTGCPMPASVAPKPAPQPADQAGGGTEGTNPQNGVTVDRSGEIITMPINLFGKCVGTTFDERLLLLVIVAGILGAFVHGATSLADYIGNNNFNKSWTWFYLLRPAIGMALALVFYFVIRGGFLSTSGGAKDINPYGIAALAGLVGMFSKQATDKLSEVFGTLFRAAPGEGDQKRQDPLGSTTGATGTTTSIQLDPPSVSAGGAGFQLAVTGTGFVDGSTIAIADLPQATTFESASRLSAQIEPETIATPTTLKVTVVNPDGTTLGPVDLAVQ